MHRALVYVLLGFLSICLFGRALATDAPIVGTIEAKLKQLEAEVKRLDAEVKRLDAENQVLKDQQFKQKKVATEAFWNKCIGVNNRFIAGKAELWFKEFRPSAVASTCRDAAKGLRALNNADVDSDVIDHVNRVVRGFEKIGAIAEVKGRESLWADAMEGVGFVVKTSSRSKLLGSVAGAVADSGSIAIGIAHSDSAKKATSAGQRQTMGVAQELIDSEERVIKNVRDKYGMELKPW